MNLSDIMDVNLEAEAVHIANKKWWIDIHTGNPITRDKGEQLMLVITELAEAMEGARKKLMDDHLPQYQMEHVEILDAFIRMLDYRYGWGMLDKFVAGEYPGPMMSNQFTLVEASFGEALGRMSGLVEDIRKAERDDLPVMAVHSIDRFLNHCYWYARWRGFGHLFLEIYHAKMDYNATRVDHSIEHRLGEHGKKI